MSESIPEHGGQGCNHCRPHVALATFLGVYISTKGRLDWSVTHMPSAVIVVAVRAMPSVPNGLQSKWTACQ